MDETLAALIRAGMLFVPVGLAAALWVWRSPSEREAAAIGLAALFCFPALLAGNGIAVALGAWHFDARGGLLCGVPVDAVLGWMVLWGVVPALLLPRAPLPVIAAVALAFDSVAMPLAAPVVVLHDGWLWGESLLLAGVLVPAQLLFRWTRDARNLAGRAALQMATFTALVFWLLPASVFAVRGGSFAALDVRGDLGASVQLQIALLPALLGLSAVQEFFERGRGTPFPYDPPHRLVTSGLFAYVRGPMQLSVALALPAWGWLLGSGWLVAAGGVALVFATGFAAWHEDTELELRFGRDWTEYRRAVSLWPRWRPWIPRPSRLYYGAGCGPCEELAGWVRRLGPSALEFVPAQQHPMRELERLTYTHPDGREEEGVAALARALEHVNLAWAMAGCLLRLPGFRHGVQLMVDASGGGRRAIPLTHEQIL